MDEYFSKSEKPSNLSLIKPVSLCQAMIYHRIYCFEKNTEAFSYVSKRNSDNRGATCYLYGLSCPIFRLKLDKTEWDFTVH